MDRERLQQAMRQRASRQRKAAQKVEAQPTYSSMDMESIGPSFAEQYLESNPPATASVKPDS